MPLPQKLGLLIQVFVEHAPHRRHEPRGTALRDGQSETAAYANKVAWFDESIWWLWQMAKKN